MSLVPHGFREDFLSFSDDKSMGAKDHKGMVNLDPRVWQDLYRGPLDIATY